jgi:hypothetical protein
VSVQLRVLNGSMLFVFVVAGALAGFEAMAPLFGTVAVAVEGAAMIGARYERR